MLTRLLRTAPFVGLPAVLAVVLLPAPASAHKMIINAWVEGDVLVTETAFGDGSPGKGVTVTVTDAATGETVLTGTADETGVFEATLPPKALARGNDLLIASDAGAGHRVTMTIPADEFSSASAAVTAPQASEGSLSSSPATRDATHDTRPAGPIAAVDPAMLKALVAEAVRAELRPLRRELQAQQDEGPTVSAIFAGIGYIFGMAGVAALVSRRRRRE